jgi:hypothetical protein
LLNEFLNARTHVLSLAPQHLNVSLQGFQALGPILQLLAELLDLVLQCAVLRVGAFEEVSYLGKFFFEFIEVVV